MSTAKRKWTLLALVAMLVCSVFGAFGVSAMPARAEEAAWSGSTFTQTQEDGQTVWTAANDGGAAVQQLNYSGTVGNNNTFTFQYRPNDVGVNDTSNVSFHVVCANGNRVTYQFLNYWNAYRICYNDGIISEGNYPPDTTDGWSENDVWFTFTCVFIENYAQIYVDGELMVTQPNTQNAFFDENATCFFTVWGCNSSVKGMTFSNTEVPANSWGGGAAVTKEGDEVVYTAATYELNYITHAGDIGDYNTVAFELRFNEIWSGYDLANATFHVVSPNGNRFSYQFINYWNCYKFLLNDGELFAGNYPPDTSDGWTEWDVWFKIKCVFIENYAQIYVGDQLMNTYVNTGDMAFTAGSTCFFTSYACQPSFKNITFSNTEVPENSWAGSYLPATEGEETVYTNTDMWALSTFYHAGKIGDYDTFSFDYRPNANVGGDTANIQLVLVDTNGNQLQYQFRNWYKYYGYFYNDNLIAEGNYATNTGAWDSTDQWFNFKCVFIDGSAQIYVNGELKHTYTQTEGMIFDENLSCFMTSWGHTPTIKNLTFSKTQVETEEPELPVEPEIPGDWVSDTYTEADGVYTAKEETGATPQILSYTKDDANNYNTMSFSFKPNAYYGGHDTANVTYNLNVGNTTVGITFMNHWKLLRAIKYVDGAEVAYLVESRFIPEESYTAGWNGYDVWYDVEVVYTNDVIIVTVDGTEQGRALNHGIDFSDVSVFFSSWACAPSITDITFSNTEVVLEPEEPDEPEIEYPTDWTSETYTIAAEGEDFVYTAVATADYGQTLTYTGDSSGSNSISFSFRPNEYYAGHDTTGLTVYVGISQTRQLAITFMNHWKLIRYAIYDNGNMAAHLADIRYESEDTYQAGWNKYDEWYEVTVSYSDLFVSVTVNGTAYKNVYHESALDYSNVYLGSWASAPSVKNMQFSTVELTVESDWYSNTFTTAKEGEETVYTAVATADYAQQLKYAKETGAYNSISFSFRPNEYYAGFDTVGIGYFVKISETRQLAITFMNHWKLVRYAIYENGDVSSHLADIRYESEDTYEAGWNKYDEWYDVTITYCDSFVVVTVNGTELDKVYYDLQLDYSTVYFNAWATAPSVRNISFATVDTSVKTWYGTTFTETEENGLPVYTAAQDGGAAAQVLYYGLDDANDYNTVSFSYRPNEYFAGYDTANVTYNVTAGNTAIGFTFMNHWKLLRVIKYVDGVETAWLIETRFISEDNYQAGWNAYDVWYDVEVTYTNDVIVVTVNGQEVGRALKHGIDFSNVSIFFSAWACAPSIADIALSDKEIQVEIPDWLSNTYTEAEGVYTAKEETGAAPQTLTYTKEDAASYNQVSFSFKPNEYYGGFDTASVAYNITVGDTVIGVTFMNHWKLLRVIKYVGGAEVAWLTEARYESEDTYEAGWNKYSDWYDVEIIYTNDIILVSVNGKQVGIAVGHGIDFSNAVIYFSSWGCAPSITDITLSETQVNVNDYLWAGSTFEKSQESGATVYTSKGDMNGLQNLAYALRTGTDNAISYDVKFTEDGFAEHERNLTFNIVSSKNGNVTAGFQLLPHWNAARLQLFYSDGSSSILGVGNYEPTEWLSVKCIFEENYLVMYVNGKLITASYNTAWNDFNNTTCHFSVWGTCASVKGMTFSQEEIDKSLLWYGPNYTQSEVDGETVYTATHDGGVNTLGYAGTTENYNVLTFEVNTDAVGSFNERNAGAAIFNYGTNANLFFEVMPERSEARIRLLSGNSTIFGVRATHAVINNHDWITVRCVFENEYVAMFINGDLVLSYFGIEDCQFSDTLCMMSAWDTAASFRNMVFSAEEYSLAELGYTDLDFLDEKGVDAVNAENATVAYDRENQEVDITVAAANPVVSVIVNQTVGGLYSAYLPIRNTILIRMANGTLAEQLRFFVLTSESDEWYEKTVEILPQSGYTTYYVNVSDLGVDGYLRGMKFAFVGATEGTVSIDAISFEREDAIYDYAAESLSAIADKQTGMVVISGKLQAKYAGKEVKVIEMDVSNYSELLTYFPQKLLGTGTADADGNFTVTFPLKQEDSEMTHLSTIFLASVDGVKLAKSFQIENYRDFVTNPYAFELPDLTVSVTDAQFGAVGDGFTNDNAAIQAAIDYVSEQGGGMVILPGNTESEYGNRYVATNLEMRSNVELRIEKGAMLWQSPRLSDYKYNVTIGHDYETDVMWPHACNINRPLILVRAVENVRITGGGTIRMLDWGGETTDPMKLIDPSHGASCGNLIHIAPLFINSATNVEVSDLSILRTNNWNLTTLYSKNMFIANMYFGESNCKNGDGVGLCNAENALVVRCRMFGTDDAFTLNAAHLDPRWSISDWGEPVGRVHKGTLNIEIAHCNMRGGLGLVFIPWGTNAEDLSTSEVRNIVVYDSIISGFGQDIGAWCDDPFYGWSSNGNFQLANGEFDDYAPIKDVYMYNNKYKFDKAVLTQLGNNVVAEATNFITDSVLKCSSQFVNSSFERNLRYDGEETWVSGLSYWSSIVGENGEVGYEARGTKEATAKYSQVDYTVTDYAGFASNGKLYQGLYLERGIYTMTATVKNAAGTAELFVGESLLKQHVWEETAVNVLSTQAVPVSDEYAEVTFTFTVKKAGVYAVGLAHSGAVGEKAYLDDVSLEQTGTVEDEEALFEKAKADTQNYLELAKSHDKNIYTAESYAALATAIANAEAALANADTDRATYEACANGLLEAMKSLVEIDFAAENKAALEQTLATAKTYTADKYTEESFAALEAAIANAEAAIVNGATAEEYESLNTALTAAIDGLTEKPAQPSEKPDDKPDDKPATGCGAVAFSSSAVALLALGATLTVFARKRKD